MLVQVLHRRSQGRVAFLIDLKLDYRLLKRLVSPRTRSLGFCDFPKLGAGISIEFG